MGKRPILVIGGGGHAKVLIDALRLQKRRVLGFADPDASRLPILGIARIGSDKAILNHKPNTVCLVNGVGSVGNNAGRARAYEYFVERGYVFERVIHPSSVVASDVELSDGVQLMARCVVQTGSRIACNVIINTAASIDHDCDIGAHSHIAPGAVLSGNVKIGEGTHIGTGACVIQGIVIGDQSLVGAGAVVIRDVPRGAVVAGVPARVIRGRADSK